MMKYIIAVIISILLFNISCKRNIFKKPIYSVWEKYYDENDYINKCYNIISLVKDTENRIVFTAFTKTENYTGDTTAVYMLENKQIFSIDTVDFCKINKNFIRSEYENEKIIWHSDKLLICYDKNDKHGQNWMIYDIENRKKSSFFKVDKFSNIWEANKKSLTQYNENEYVHHLQDLYFNNICFDNSGILYASTLPFEYNKAGMILKYDYSKWDTLITCSNDFNFVASMNFDNNGNLWYSVYNRSAVGSNLGEGLFKYDGNSTINYNIYNSGLSSNSISEIDIDKDNNKWLSTYGGGLVKFSNDNKWTVFDSISTPLYFPSTEHIVTGEDNNIWFTVQFYGLVKMVE